MLCIPLPVRASLIVLFDTAESRHLCMQVVSLASRYVRKAQEHCCHLMVEVSLA